MKGGKQIAHPENILFLFSLLLFCLALLLSFGPQGYDRDIGWHIIQGDWTLKHGAVYRQDVFNFGNTGKPFVAEYPVFQVLAAVAWRGGDAVLSLFQVILAGLLAWGILLSARGTRVSPLFIVPAAFLCLLLMSLRLALRPEMFTYLGVVYFSVRLLRVDFTPGRWDFLGFFVAQVLWTNTHSGFILGPVLVGAFALDRVCVEWMRRKFNFRTMLEGWGLLFGVTVLATFCNPAGPRRWLLPLFHQNNLLIKDYVSEMQPLSQLGLPLYSNVVAILPVLLVIAIVCSRFRLSRPLAFLAFVFCYAAMESWRHLALCGLFFLLAFLQLGPLGSSSVIWKHLGRMTLLAGCAALLFLMTLQVHPASPLSVKQRWVRAKAGQSDYPEGMLGWLQAHARGKRLLHRSEIGGWLQFRGFSHGETWADTGYGKFSESFIRELGLAGARPGCLPVLLKKYRPDFVLASIGSYEWIPVLQSTGWHCVFYSSTGSVWAENGRYPDLPPVSREQVLAAFTAEKTPAGFLSPFWNNRRYLALHQFGLTDEAFHLYIKNQGQRELDDSFWGFLGELCFGSVTVPPALVNEAVTWAEGAGNPESSTAFRALALKSRGRNEEARVLLETIPQSQPHNLAFVALASLYLDSGNPEAAQKLLSRQECFTFAGVERPALLARAYAARGKFVEASSAFVRAVQLAPDDLLLRDQAMQFLKTNPDARLETVLAEAMVWIAKP